MPLQKNFLFIVLLIIATLFAGVPPTPAMELPAEGIKKLPMAPEESVSTYVTSSAAPGEGLACNIIYPQTPRYKKDGAPVVVVVPGGEGPSGLTTTMHGAQAGFVELRFAFPGGGLKKFHSGGSWDERGKDSQLALRDILLFAHGEKPDTKGKYITDLIPTKVDLSNVGAVAWENGGNILIVTMAKFPLDLGFMKWIAFYESPIGNLMIPSCLGTTKELVVNRYYRQGSAATGKPLIDYRKLAWQGGIYRNRNDAMKLGREPSKGVLFFDENANKVWEESREFPIAYAGEPGGSKQFYPPEVVKAIRRLRIFPIGPGSGAGPGHQDGGKAGGGAASGAAGAAAAGGGTAGGKGGGGAGGVNPAGGAGGGKAGGGGNFPNVDNVGGGTTNNITSGLANVFKGGGNTGLFGMGKKGGGAAPAAGGGGGGGGAAAAAAGLDPYRRRWPPQVATLEESEAYFGERDGTLFIKQIPLQYPDLLVMVFGSRLDHMQRQIDHPHIALNYNLWLASKPRWLRLNPDPKYVGLVADMNGANFVDNPPNSSIDASTMDTHLEPEGFIQDDVFMQACIAELADRARTDNLNSPLSAVLVDYSNEAMKAYKKEMAQKQAQQQAQREAQQN